MIKQALLTVVTCAAMAVSACASQDAVAAHQTLQAYDRFPVDAEALARD